MAAAIRRASRRRLREGAAEIWVIGNVYWARDQGTRSATVNGVTLAITRRHSEPIFRWAAGHIQADPGFNQWACLNSWGHLALRNWREQAHGTTFANHLHCQALLRRCRPPRRFLCR